MSILLAKETRVLVQGLTGKEGRRAAEAMRAYGTKVIGGVTPGKGGAEVDGVPVFGSVREAEERIGRPDAAALYVPPGAVKDAALEAIAAGIPLISITAERVPVRDAAFVLAAARERGCRILGPGSLGAIVPGVGRLGVIGGPLVNEIFTPGTVGVISRSGGMTNELSWNLRRAGFGQSAAVHLGGEPLVGTSCGDMLDLFEQDPDTEAVAMYGEHGGFQEFEIAERLASGRFTKPIAVCIGGAFARFLPEGLVVGHAGAIVAKGASAEEKAAALRAAGAHIAERFEDLVECLKPHIACASRPPSPA